MLEGLVLIFGILFVILFNEIDENLKKIHRALDREQSKE